MQLLRSGGQTGRRDAWISCCSKAANGWRRPKGFNDPSWHKSLEWRSSFYLIGDSPLCGKLDLPTSWRFSKVWFVPVPTALLCALKMAPVRLSLSEIPWKMYLFLFITVPLLWQELLVTYFSVTPTHSWNLISGTAKLLRCCWEMTSSCFIF